MVKCASIGYDVSLSRAQCYWNDQATFYMSIRSLEAWKACQKFAISIYRITESFPVTERYGITSQLRRVAVSTSSNIAEGYDKQLDEQQSDAGRLTWGLYRWAARGGRETH